MRVLVFGSQGQLGNDICQAFTRNSDQVCGVTHAEVAIESLSQVREFVSQNRPDLIINTAAFHHVERCEQEPSRAYAINAGGPHNIALAANECGAIVMQISTDYVFDGLKQAPYEEADSPRPLNVYGASKLAGEYLVRTTTSRHYVLRTSALYGSHPCRAKGGLNFVDLMLKLARERKEIKVVDYEMITPTSTVELARQIVKLSRCETFGLYHATAEGSCSWYEFAQHIFELAELRVHLRVAGPDDFPAKVARPKYSVLENRALKMIGFNTFGSWLDGLRSYLSMQIHASQGAV